ncbi:extensin family protein [uncultured Aliiroseovarius sp.]|uniref:extensin-like domain-containing protein n=1 Tax=uncultured Aliiroseovarius sp. TaxID=1658783 RepID=UPI00261E3E5B|nr:extensin family protein [uncultured Aliiroseovarius sp.]
MRVIGFGVRAVLKRSLGGVVLAAMFSTTAMSAPPDSSLRPTPRPASNQGVIATSGAQLAAAVAAPTRLAVARSLRPNKRPKGFSRKVAASMPAPANVGRKGRVCGVNEIKGQAVSAIPGKIRGCGVADPVRVTEVSGVKLSQAAVMDCTTAKALNNWVRTGVFPAVGRLGGGPSSLRVVAHYACRTRNNKSGAKISEHGKGRALDIAAVRLKNGAEISVLKGWRDPVQGKVLKSMHKAACGPFGTVLGPNADRYHQDHLHLDTARYRSGAYCR